MLKVLFVSPEAAPYAKTGGLADVAGALPGALRRLGADVRLVLPLYRIVRDRGYRLSRLRKNLKVPLGNQTLAANVMETRNGDGVPVYFVEREDLYDRPNLYGDGRGDYYDNLERFTFFSHAALKLAESLSFKPDAIHCHDWETGLIPALIKGPYKRSKIMKAKPTVFTIHNLGYQGLFPVEKFPITTLSKEAFFHLEGLEYWGKMSLLKAGIVFSQAITTVSPTYAREIQEPKCGMGMENILKRQQEFLHGILNGIDYRLWDPARDPDLPANYSLKNLTGKIRCKESLIQELGLDPSLLKRPLLGMTSRLDGQKGLDLLVKMLDKLLALEVGLVILGAGDAGIQKALEKAARHHRRRIGLTLGFNEPLAHRIMAGADIFLIPSRYEPCGLTQMYALKYGTVPVVRATGGLEDTVANFNSRTLEGNGFKFGPYEPDALFEAIRQAIEVYNKPSKWKTLMQNGMKEDFSWDRSARSYMEIYRSVIQMKPNEKPQ